MMRPLVVKTAIVAVVGLCLATATYYLVDHHLSAKRDYATVEKKAPFADITTVVINTTSGNVYLKQRNNKEAEARLLFTTPKRYTSNIDIERKDKTLTITAKKSLREDESNITMKLPAGVKSVFIHTTTGEIKADYLKLDTINVATTSGNVNVHNINANAKKVTINSISGNIRLSFKKIIHDDDDDEDEVPSPRKKNYTVKSETGKVVIKQA